VPEAVARFNLQPLGRLPTTNRLHLAIGLPLTRAASSTSGAPKSKVLSVIGGRLRRL